MKKEDGDEDPDPRGGGGGKTSSSDDQEIKQQEWSFGEQHIPPACSPKKEEPNNSISSAKETTENKSHGPVLSVEQPNRGTLLVDATCVPADIAYPTDLNLLNTAREKLEAIIDTLYEPLIGQDVQKPRTYREQARKNYLAVAKKRRPGSKKVRKAVKKQLNYIKRDLKHIEELVRTQPLSLLRRRQYRELLVIQELYRQQREMYQAHKHRVNDRNISIHQPHVRPIVCGKASAMLSLDRNCP